MTKLQKLAVVASAAAFASTSQAALPTGVDTAVSSLQTDALAAVDLIVPAVIAVTSAFIVVRIIKKVLSKVG